MTTPIVRMSGGGYTNVSLIMKKQDDMIRKLSKRNAYLQQKIIDDANKVPILPSPDDQPVIPDEPSETGYSLRFCINQNPSDIVELKSIKVELEDVTNRNILLSYAFIIRSLIPNMECYEYIPNKNNIDNTNKTITLIALTDDIKNSDGGYETRYWTYRKGSAAILCEYGNGNSIETDTTEPISSLLTPMVTWAYITINGNVYTTAYLPVNYNLLFSRTITSDDRVTINQAQFERLKLMDVRYTETVEAMFRYCDIEDTSVIKNWTLDNCYLANWLFAGCSKLMLIDCSEWVITSNLTVSNMLGNAGDNAIPSGCTLKCSGMLLEKLQYDESSGFNAFTGSDGVYVKQ